MSPHRLTDKELFAAVKAYNDNDHNKSKAARALRLPINVFRYRLDEARLRKNRSVAPVPEPINPFPLENSPPPAYTGGHEVEIVSNRDNTFLFGAAGDMHAASKYCRYDVRDGLYKWFENEGAICNFDTGNWIDGECNFNRYDLEKVGFDSQMKLLADRHPKNVPTYAVWGDDHEGWYVQRESIDVGSYAENIMQQAGHKWVNLGYLEAHVGLVNKNSGKVASMAVAHPGGGSAYALSYSIQKIIESYEGGEKPACALFGHYHKLMSALIRNVWTAQTGCQQDQTPFMRKKRLEAHVGGSLIKLTQDPRTGAIIRMQYEAARYFNKDYYQGGRWSRHGSVRQVERSRVWENEKYNASRKRKYVQVRKLKVRKKKKL